MPRWIRKAIARYIGAMIETRLLDRDDAVIGRHGAIKLHGPEGFAGMRAAGQMPDTEEEAMNRFLTDEIELALSTLPPRDAKVLRLYFGLEGGREHTLEEIGSMLGVTRERVRQLRDRALKRLREGDVGRALSSFAA